MYGNSQLEQVKGNMQSADAFKFRSNTGNTGYGFEQVLDHDNDGLLNQPNGMGVKGALNNGMYDPNQDGPNTYQFAAAGNLGSLVARKSANVFGGHLKYNMQKI